MAREQQERTSGPPRGRRDRDRDVVIDRECKLCEERLPLDFKGSEFLRKFMTERGRILPRRITGTCAKHQRELARAIKRARVMMLVR
jgi:small subunit ribosomal protein S18